MAWNLETAKVYLGIDDIDTSKDTIIQQTLDTVLANLELLLQRRLLLDREIAEFHDESLKILLLPRFPITQVYTVDDEPLPDTWYVHNTAGWIEMPCYRHVQEMKVDYMGGYGPLPADLERAMWEAFMVRWGNTDSDTGGPAGAVEGSAELKSLTVYDGFKMEFDVAAASSSSSGGIVERELMWGWLSPWASIFEMYRSEHGVALGMF